MSIISFIVLIDIVRHGQIYIVTEFLISDNTV